MVSSQNFTVAMFATQALLNKYISQEAYLKSEDNVFGTLLYLLAQAMHFSFQVSFSDTGGIRLPNSTWTGMIGMLNRSEADIICDPIYISEERKEAVTFAYPFDTKDVTFMTRNPEYSPAIFAIFYTFAKYVWITLGVFVVTMILAYFTLISDKRSFVKATFAVLAVCLSQPLNFRSTAAGEKLLILSWMVGMAFFSMSYKSVLLSFLTFPPLSGISTVSELARAVEAGEYSCMTYLENPLPSMLLNSTEKKLRVISNHFLQSDKGYGDIEDFFDMNDNKIAYIDARDDLLFAQERYFISKDSLHQTFSAMAVRKDFCSKEQLDMAMHRIKAAGLIEKLFSDIDYRLAYRKFSSVITEKDPRRPLTLRDVSSAFIFLIAGYCVSFAVLIGEILVRNIEKYRLSAKKVRKKKETCNVFSNNPWTRK